MQKHSSTNFLKNKQNLKINKQKQKNKNKKKTKNNAFTVGFMKRSFSKKTKCFNLLFFAQINLISVVDGLESKNIQL